MIVLKSLKSSVLENHCCYFAEPLSAMLKHKMFTSQHSKEHRDGYVTAQQINVFDKRQQFSPDFGRLFLIEHFLDIVSIVAAAQILKEEQSYK